MAFVAAAYLIIAALFVGYGLTLVGRQRVIAELTDAVQPDQGRERS